METTPEVSDYMAAMARKSHRRFDGKTPLERRYMTAKATYTRVLRRDGPAAAAAWVHQKFPKVAPWLLLQWLHWEDMDTP